MLRTYFLQQWFGISDPGMEEAFYESPVLRRFAGVELKLPFTHIADQLDDPRACDTVMLGALLEIANMLPQASIDAALRRLVKRQKWVDLDERALAPRRELYRNSLRDSKHEMAY